MSDYGNMNLPDMKGGRLFGSHYGEAAPWTPGVKGKGLIHKGKPYLWRAEMGKGDPHHPDVLQTIDPTYGSSGITGKTDGLFTVNEKGGVEPAIWDHGDLNEFAQHHPGLTAPPSSGDKLNDLLDSEWHFGKTASDLHNWEPGTFGKGFVMSDGTPVTWSLTEPAEFGSKAEARGPHHSDYAAAMGLNESPEGYEEYTDDAGGWHTPVYIKPDGEVGEMGYWPSAEQHGMEVFHNLPGLKGPKDPNDWHFGSSDEDGEGYPDWQVVRSPLHADENRHPHPDHGDRLPVIIDYDTRKLHVGNLGDTHGEVHEEQGVGFKRGDTIHGALWGDHTLEVYGPMAQGDAIDAAHAIHPTVKPKQVGWHMNPWPSEDADDWHFAALQDPYHDPEFMDDDWEDKFGDEMVADMHRKAPPAELERRLREGVLPGQQGKGVELPDGAKHFWKTDGSFGWPHHDDMLRHMRVFNRDGVKYLHVGEDGKAEDFGNIGGDSEWNF